MIAEWLQSPSLSSKSIRPKDLDSLSARQWTAAMLAAEHQVPKLYGRSCSGLTWLALTIKHRRCQELFQQERLSEALRMARGTCVAYQLKGESLFLDTEVFPDWYFEAFCAQTEAFLRNGSFVCLEDSQALLEAGSIDIDHLIGIFGQRAGLSLKQETAMWLGHSSYSGWVKLREDGVDLQLNVCASRTPELMAFRRPATEMLKKNQVHWLAPCWEPGVREKLKQVMENDEVSWALVDGWHRFRDSQQTLCGKLRLEGDHLEVVALSGAPESTWSGLYSVVKGSDSSEVAQECVKAGALSLALYLAGLSSQGSELAAQLRSKGVKLEGWEEQSLEIYR